MALTGLGRQDRAVRMSDAGGRPWAVMAALVALAPVAALMLAALLGTDSGETVRLAQTRLPDYAATSAGLAILVALGVGILGGGLAWLIAMYRFPGRDMFDWALMLPLAAPAYVLAYAYLDLTTAAGPLQSTVRAATGWTFGDYWFPEVSGLFGAAFVFSLAYYPYVYALARRAFGEQAATLMDAGRTLGRGPWGVFRGVALPLARPALIAGMALALMETLADYGAVAHLGVPTFTFGVLRAWSAAGEPIAAARLAAILLIVCLALLAIERRARGRARVAVPRGSHSRSPHQLAGGPAWAAVALCGLVLTFGLFLPAGYLAILALDTGLLAPRTMQSAGHSVLLGTTAAAIAALIAYGLTAGARAGSSWSARTKELTAAGYAVPGAVAALGVLFLTGAARDMLAPVWAIGIGGIPLLLLAYQTRYAAAAVGPISSAFERMPPSLDAAARSLGCGPRDLTRRVHLPILAPSIATAIVLVFVEVVKELPATMILRPFDFDTLAVLAHAYASDERLAQAAVPALLIVLICAPPMAFAAHAMNRSRNSRT